MVPSKSKPPPCYASSCLLSLLTTVLFISSTLTTLSRAENGSTSSFPPLPAISFDANKAVVLQNVDFPLYFQTFYAQGDYIGVDSFYFQVYEGERLLAEGNKTVFNDDGDFEMDHAVYDLQVKDRGDVPIRLVISYARLTAGGAPTNDTEVAEEEHVLWVIPGAVTILPPLIIIILSLVTGHVQASLFAGIWMACLFIYHYNPFTAFLRVIDTYLIESLADIDHAFIIIFSWFLSGLVACVQKSGGGNGIAATSLKVAKGRYSGMAVFFGIGFVIFFDDYANTLILGQTMRPISDLLKISREKFCFIVDSTTAPVASIAPISSWIGYQLSLIAQELDALADAGYDLAAAGIDTSPYTIFLKSIPSSYYSIFMLFFQVILIASRRDFGPMLRAERRAMDQGKLVADDAKPEETGEDGGLEDEELPEGLPVRWWNGVVPIVFTIIIVFLGLILTGLDTTKANDEPVTIQNIFGNGDSFSSLIWGGFVGSAVAWIMYRYQYYKNGQIMSIFTAHKFPKEDRPRPILYLDESFNAWIEGIRELTSSIIILIMAWAIGAAVKNCGTADFFSSMLSDSLDPRALPVLSFIISAIISFCTGSSWGTMAIMFPLIVPTAWIASQDETIFITTISSILTGSVFGDHCTPISDTTVLSAMACRCDLRHHVKTQMPYALSVALISILIGYLPVGFAAYPNYVGLLIGVLTLFAFIIFIGIRIDHPQRRDDIFTIIYYAILKCLGKSVPEKVIPDDTSKKPYVDILNKEFYKASNWRKSPPDEQLEFELSRSILNLENSQSVRGRSAGLSARSMGSISGSAQGNSLYSIIRGD